MIVSIVYLTKVNFKLTWFVNYVLIGKRKPIAGMGCLEFVDMMTIKEEYRLRERLTGLFSHYSKMNTKDPKDVEILLNSIVQTINNTVTSDLNIGSDRIHLEGILDGSDILGRLKSFVNLLEDEMQQSDQI